jgi:hypothetical protein
MAGKQDDALAEYKAKRRFDETPEPPPVVAQPNSEDRRSAQPQGREAALLSP